MARSDPPKIFRHSWTIRQSAEPTLVLPDGACDIYWDGGDLRVAGPSRQAQLEDYAGKAWVVGQRFDRGSALSWLDMPMREIIGLTVPLHELGLSRRVERLVDMLKRAETASDASQIMARCLADRMPANRDRVFATEVLGALALRSDDDAVIIPSLLTATGLSERTLRRRCHEVFGYGPRTLSRVLRLQRLLDRLHAAPGRSLADVAAAAGYSDQPHLNREVRALTGLTPSMLAGGSRPGGVRWRGTRIQPPVCAAAPGLAVSFKTRER